MNIIVKVLFYLLGYLKNCYFYKDLILINEQKFNEQFLDNVFAHSGNGFACASSAQKI